MLKDAVLITGAGQRIGLHLAKRFIEKTNYPVIFTYRTHHAAVDELIAMGAKGFQVDFSQTDSWQTFIHDLPSQVESLRTLIHNASLWIPEDKLGENGYEQMFDVHMKVPYALTKACIPLLQNCSTEMADIIALSDSKTQQGHANYIAYLTTKAGLESMMQSFAKALAPKVKANVISPGLVMFNDRDSDHYKQARLDRMANPDEIGPDAIWRSVEFLMQSAHASASKIELGHLQV